MDGQVLANAAAVEQGVSGSTTLTLPWRSRLVMLVNDSSTVDAQIFIGGGSGFTLKALETFSAPMWVESIRVSCATSTNLRFWGFG